MDLNRWNTRLTHSSPSLDKFRKCYVPKDLLPNLEIQAARNLALKELKVADRKLSTQMLAYKSALGSKSLFQKRLDTDATLAKKEGEITGLSIITIKDYQRTCV